MAGLTLSEVPLPEKDEAGNPVGRPDGKVREILRRLRGSSRIAQPDTPLPISQLSANDMAVLNAFASQLAGGRDCTVRSIDGCHSCSCGSYTIPHDGGICDKWGNLVHTDCGLQCWLCSVECD